jgi:hypothetical protein
MGYEAATRVPFTIVKGVPLECSSLELLHNISVPIRHMSNKLFPLTYLLEESAAILDRAHIRRWVFKELFQTLMLL